VIAFIIAGGSGTRLWPLSTPAYPKHLLSLTNEHTLIQNTVARAAKITSVDKIFVLTEASHAHHVQDQLAEFPADRILIEPARRGTASCVLLAMQHLETIGVGAHEPVAFLWADHVIHNEQGFAETFLQAARLAETYDRAVFIGAQPTYPATGFGYMEHGDNYQGLSGVYELSRFHEKPELERAEAYIASGKFFWNMGYVVMSRFAFERDLAEYSPEYLVVYQTVHNAADKQAAYMSLQNIALEYVFSEKIQDGLVIPGNFDWVDVGSFTDLHAIQLSDDQGNHVRGGAVALDSVTNSYINNETGTPVAVIGLDNVVVVNSPNGILVMHKDHAQKIKDVSARLQQ
jgi:mannose-1-phosphate guanylyltransferase/mannose-6-phosphate isomerase